MTDAAPDDPPRRSRLADRAATPWGIGTLAFAETLLLPVPIEAVLLPLMIREPHRRWAMAGWALLGSVIGMAVLYGIGLAFMDVVGDRVLALNGWTDEYAELRDRFEEDGAATVAVIAVTPIPFTMGALAAGAARMSVIVFLAVAGATRLARYAGLAVLVGLFGERVRAWYEQARRDPRAHVVSLVLIVAAVALIAWLWLR